MDRKLYAGIPIDDSGAVFKVSKDHMLAFVEGVNKENLILVWEKLKPILNKYGISFGVLNSPELEKGVLIVARGKKPKDGVDGRIEIVASSYLDNKESKKEKEDGEQDPRNLCLINNVTKGEIIAKRIHPTPGEPGQDVFGNSIPPKPGNWVPFKLGNLVELIDEDTMTAADSGALLIKHDGTISIATEWTIDGNVDFSTGHVEFYGEKLVIKGSVLGGFTVEAMGDLIVGRNIEDETIVLAGGNLTVKGIIRSQNTMVKTGGHLHCEAIEYARVFVGQDLNVTEYVLNSCCQVHGNVSVLGGKGLVAGGEILAGSTIKVKTAGTSANVATLLSAGRDPLLEMHHEGLVKEQESLSRKLYMINEGLKKIERLRGSQPKAHPKFEAIKENLQEAAMTIIYQMNVNKEKIAQLEKDLGAMEQATVTILGRAYPNVTIKICDTSITLREAVGSLLFFFKNGEVAARTLE